MDVIPLMTAILIIISHIVLERNVRKLRIENKQILEKIEEKFISLQKYQRDKNVEVNQSNYARKLRVVAFENELKEIKEKIKTQMS